MIGIGTIINSATIVVASLFGLLIGSKLNEDLRNALMRSLGLVVVLIGLTMAIKTREIVLLTVSILIGTAMGEMAGIERGLENLGKRVERRFEASKFAEGFVSATLLFCVGSMAIVGPIQEGLTGDYSLLITKSMLDGVAAIALASTLGIGVIFSSVSVLLYQGFFTILAVVTAGMLPEGVVNEITATGGILIVAIGLRLMGVVDLKPGNMLPSLLISPILVYVF
ncbi:MAG: DUF554 domain-containing protein [Archaeoglobus sp.]|nr:DUF554 domain-containing protein [Archaeoglobus sp.]